MKRIEDLTDAELDALVAEKIMEEWTYRHHIWWDNKNMTHMEIFKPSTDPALFFLVDKPGWTWRFEELIGHDKDPWLLCEVFKLGIRIAWCDVSLDPDNKAAAYCRGRCIVALKVEVGGYTECVK